MRGKPWPQEVEATAIRMWKAGKTGSDIADAVGRSRCAVMGKLDRLGLIGDCTEAARAKRQASAFERMSRATRTRWARLSLAERAEWGRAMSAGHARRRSVGL